MNNSNGVNQIHISDVRIYVSVNPSNKFFWEDGKRTLERIAYGSCAINNLLDIHQFRIMRDEYNKGYLWMPNNVVQFPNGTKRRFPLLEYYTDEIRDLFSRAFLDELLRKAPQLLKQPIPAPEYEYLEDEEPIQSSPASQIFINIPLPEPLPEPKAEEKPKRRTCTLPPSLVKRAIREMTEKKMEMTSRSINKYITENYFKYSE